MSKEATEFFRKERLALEQEAKRAKEQNKALEKQVGVLESTLGLSNDLLKDVFHERPLRHPLLTVIQIGHKLLKEKG